MSEKRELIGLIGGTGLNRLPGLKIAEERAVTTPYGEPSGPLVLGRLEGQDMAFLARHGPGHIIPPHRINYRANIRALREAGVKRVLAVAAMGGIGPDMQPGQIAVPNQIIDYTWGRAHTFFEGHAAGVAHIDFTNPYSESLREALLNAAVASHIDVVPHGTYGATQGPRLESAAEIQRLARDGCDLVGMTGMPEAALAREAGLEYAGIAAVVNWAAGMGGDGIHADIETYTKEAMARVHSLITAFVEKT